MGQLLCRLTGNARLERMASIKVQPREPCARDERVPSYFIFQTLSSRVCIQCHGCSIELRQTEASEAFIIGRVEIR